MRVISTFPLLPDTTQTVTLNAVQYRLRLYWRDRLAGWYVDLVSLAGEGIALGRRVSPGSIAVPDVHRIEAVKLPGGGLLAFGPQAGAQEDSGIIIIPLPPCLLLDDSFEDNDTQGKAEPLRLDFALG